MNTRNEHQRGASPLTLLTLWPCPPWTKSQDALTNVIDPELGLDFVELGLIYEVEVEDGEVFVTFTLTSPGCPIGPQVAEQIEEFVSELDGVDARLPEDDVHARLDAGHDERGREVRPRLLTEPAPRHQAGRRRGSRPRDRASGARCFSAWPRASCPRRCGSRGRGRMVAFGKQDAVARRLRRGGGRRARAAASTPCCAWPAAAPRCSTRARSRWPTRCPRPRRGAGIQRALRGHGRRCVARALRAPRGGRARGRGAGRVLPGHLQRERARRAASSRASGSG